MEKEEIFPVTSIVNRDCESIDFLILGMLYENCKY